MSEELEQVRTEVAELSGVLEEMGPRLLDLEKLLPKDPAADASNHGSDAEPLPVENEPEPVLVSPEVQAAVLSDFFGTVNLESWIELGRKRGFLPALPDATPEDVTQLEDDLGGTGAKVLFRKTNPDNDPTWSFVEPLGGFIKLA